MTRVPPRTVTAVTAIGAMALGALAACGGSDDRLVVFGASSLADVLDDVAERFEADHPGVDVAVNTAGSSSLVAQLAGGARADVLATADLDTMERARLTGALAGAPVTFARNELVIAVEPGNPLGITALDDLTDPGTVVVQAAPEVPAGRYADRILRCAGVDLEPVSYEQSVRAAASKVALGEADAAIVYRTDIGAGLASVDIEPGCRVDAEYAVAVASDGELAARFVATLLGPVGTEALVAHGFEVPSR